MKTSEFQNILEDLKRRKIPAAVKKAVEILLTKKAEQVTVLKLKDISQVTDYIVICQGNSTRQNQALIRHIVDGLREGFQIKPYGTEGEKGGEWILVDYVDFIINIFLPDIRSKYALEKLWMDAKRYDFPVSA